MKKEDFNSEWQFVKGYVPSLKVLAMYGKQAQKITLPHDAMIHETDMSEGTKNVVTTEVLQDFIREAYTPILKRFRCRRSGKKKR